MTSIVVLGSSPRFSLHFVIFRFFHPRRCRANQVACAQDSYLDAEVSPPIGDFEAICTEIYGKLWDFLRIFEVEYPFEHVVGHFRTSCRSVIHPSPELVDVTTVLFKRSYW